ncbi:MAG: hypothetical protein GY757_31160 [bacterium]|nr:hypothetical protein [bacterium]
MLIANPIYDVVFKYLMANLDIAKGVIGTIIDEDIAMLDFKAQESVHKAETGFKVFHLDFIAKIRNKDGNYKNVLIELQKSNLPFNIMRFRKYLGEQYRREDEVLADDGSITKGPLPILTIYFLGFHISKSLPAAIKVARNYTDILQGTEIHEQNDFIEKLSHDSYVIQIPALHVKLRNRLEYVLSIFQQEKFTDKSHHLKRYDYKTTDSLMKRILKQLQKAAGDEKLRRQLELEEVAMMEYESAFGEMQRSLQKKEKELKQINVELKEKNSALKEKDSVLKEKNSALKEKDNYIKELLQQLEKKK